MDEIVFCFDPPSTSVSCFNRPWGPTDQELDLIKSNYNKISKLVEQVAEAEFRRREETLRALGAVPVILPDRL